MSARASHRFEFVSEQLSEAHEREDLPGSLGRGRPRQIPAVLLVRLALDQSLHGQGLGGALLAEALSRVVAATEMVAARFVVVDAIDQHAATFCEHHGFRPIPATVGLTRKSATLPPH
jgi:GNAT superfamily N-acetyltransferase